MRRYSVYKKDNGIVRNVGTVQADNHVQADNKARRMYGLTSWVKEEERELSV